MTESQATAYSVLGEQAGSVEDIVSLVTPEFCQDVIAQYQEWHNLSNENHGAKLSHNTLTDGLYSRSNLPVLMSMYQWANSEESLMNISAREDTATAIYAIGRSLSILHQYTQEKDLTASAAFADMRSALLKGDTTFSSFLSDMQSARQAAAITIYNHWEKIPDTTPLPVGTKRYEGLDFFTMARKALHEFQESEEGINFGPEFQARLEDEKTKAVVLSLDINSTFNVAESFANLPLIDSATAQLQTLAERFKTTYPQKQLYMVLNTGRPGLYAWGVWESLPPIPEIRQFALGESGGAILQLEGTQLKTEVAVEKPYLWKEQLGQLSSFLLSEIRNRGGVLIEPKESMLSIRIASRLDEGGQFLYTTRTGELVSDEWIAKKVQQFITESEKSFRAQLHELELKMKDEPAAIELIKNTLADLGEAGADGIQGTPDDLISTVTKTLEAITADSESHRAHEMKEISESLETIILMKQKLISNFNATAGYVDIGHSALNKYSTLIARVGRDGYTPEDMLVVHIGDSSTDILPTDQTAPGQINHGADDAYLVALANSSGSLVKAAQSRGLTGIRTSRDAVLGLSDAILGILRLVPQKNGDQQTQEQI